MTKISVPFRLRDRKAFLLAATLLGACLQASPVLPSGGAVVAGVGAVNQAGSTLTVTQSSAKLAVNWDSFSIGADAAVRFVQPSASAVALNRVTGGDPSVIQGSLTSNGQVFLLNPSGVLFSKTAQVSVGGLVASTLALGDEDFLAGRYAFAGPGAGVVVNEGNLVALGGGSVSLISARVVNTGDISAERGAVNLAAGARVTLNLGGLVNLVVEEGAVDALVRNGGAIRADGGDVLLTARGAGELAAAAISTEGLIEARTLATGEKGRILLLGGMAGGDTVTAGGRLDISAPQGGDGGFVETSAARVVTAGDLRIDGSAVAGRRGVWLLDPDFLNIVATGGVDVPTANGVATGYSEISVATLSAALNSADVTLQAIQQIDFQAPFNHVATQDATLTLLAPAISLGADISVTGGKLGLVFGDGSVAYPGHVFLYNPVSAASLTRTVATNGGDILFNGDIGGHHSFLIDAGQGQVRFASSVSGTFSAWQQVFADLAFTYQTGGGTVGRTGRIDFSVPNVKVYDPVALVWVDVQKPPERITNSQKYGNPDFVFPDGYIIIPTGTILDLNATNSPIVLTRPDGTTYNGLSSDPNGNILFTSPQKVLKIDFVVSNASWTEVYAAGISYVDFKVSGKPVDLVVKGSQVTIDPAKTLAVDGSIRIATAKFLNYSGVNALQPGAGGWQVWSTNPTPFNPISGDINGGLRFDFKQYGSVFGQPVLGAGNGLFYSITPALTLSLVNTVTKVYDRQFDASNLTNGNYAVASGAIGGDVIGFSGNLPAHGLHLSYNVGSGISITSDVIGNASITATSSVPTGSKPVFGYVLASNTASGNIGIITKAPITAITGVTANNKVYDGLLGASLNLNPGSQQFAGMFPGDFLEVTGGTGSFTTAGVANAKTVTVTGLTFGGVSLGNYSLPANFTVRADITKAPLLVLANNDSKTYNRLVYTGGNGVVYQGLVNGEQSNVLSGTLGYTGDSQGAVNAGSYTITPRGLSSVNYEISYQSGTLTINRALITGITGVAARDKVYDGLPGATLDLAGAVLTGLVPGDQLILTGAQGAFATVGAGPAKLVNVTGLTFTGTAAANYDLPAGFALSAAITKAPLTVTARADSKTYDRVPYVGGNGVDFNGLVNLETPGVLGGAIAYQGASQGALNAGSYLITPAGLTSDNYQISYVSGNLTIAKATISAINGVTARNKVYDGQTGAVLDLTGQSLVGLLPGDILEITAATGVFDSPDAGPGKTVTVGGLTFAGPALANYELPSGFLVYADITKAPLSVIARDFSKPHTGTPYLGGNGVSYSGLVNGELPTVLTGILGYAGPSQGAVNAGTYAISPGGLSSGNYQLIFVDGLLTIGAPAAAVDPREFLPRPPAVPLYPIAPLAVQAPLTVGGLNYVPVTTPEAGGAGATSGTAVGTAPGKIGEAVDRIDKGASRAIQGPTDVLVINGGINLGAKPLSAE